MAGGVVSAARRCCIMAMAPTWLYKGHIEGGPDLVVAILSPANTRADMEEKLSDYWVIQVQECWLVSPEARTVEVLQPAESGFERRGL